VRVRILIVEDEHRIADFIARGLRSESHEPLVLHDGDHLLEAVAEHEPALVILDLMLPGRDGFALLRLLRERRPHLPVIVLSARRDAATRVATLRDGAVDFVTKPFSFDELLERIRLRAAERTTDDARALVRVGDITLDRRHRQVDVGSGPVPLTDREYELLEYLMRHPEQPVSPERLLSAVWGYDFQPSTNVLAVSMRRLRQKVGYERIRTVRSQGYELMAGG
jgi:DNA-binding response OmpR family regulator